MAYGIDDVVQDKVDAYRGNPAALQKRHAASKELIDLLALQKLKSEKDSAARQMQMQMDNKPQTIAQQMEAELVGQTKNEMLQGVAGVMKTNQAKQQANMQRVAGAGLPKSAAAAPPQGLAAQPKPNMQQMAQGGIVGYAPGGEVQEKSDKIAKIRARTDIDESIKYQMIQALLGKQGYKDPTTLDDDAAKAQKVRAARDMAGDPKAMNPTLGLDALKSGPTKMVGGDYKDRGAMNVVTKGMQGNALGTGALRGEGEVPDPMAGVGDDMMAGLGGPAIEPPAAPEVKPDDGIAALRAAVDNVPKPVDVPMPKDTSSISFDAAAYKPDMTKANEYKAGIATKFRDMMAQDPAAAAAAKRKEALAYIDYTDEEKALRQANIDELKGIEKKRYGSEDQLRRDRLIQNLISASGSTVGGALASGARGSIAERDKQRAGIDSLMAARQKAQTEQMDKSQAIRKTAYGEGTSAENQAYENIRTGVSGLRGLSSDAEKRAVADADRLASLNIAKENKSMQNRQMELRASLQIAEQIFRGKESRYKGDVTVAVKVIEATMAKEKNAITAQHNAAIQAIQEGQGRTQLTKVIATIGQVIGNIEKLYVDAYAPMMAEAAAGAGRKEYKGPTVAEIKAQIEKSVAASTQDLTTLLDDSKQRLDGGSSNDGYTVNTI